MGTYSFDFGPLVIAGSPRPVDGIPAARAPRRTVLDKLLVDAAVMSGVEVREGFTVEDILIEDGTVVGIRGHADGGTTVEERARVVIGADGHNSRVARAVQAERYNELPVLENAFYTFWRDLPVDGFTTDLARLEPPPPEMQQLLGAVATDQAAMDDFVSVTAGSLSPAAFFDPDNIGRIAGAAAPA